MIKTIHGTGSVSVYGGTGARPGWFDVNATPDVKPMAGAVRYNPMSGALETYNGISWVTFPTDAVEITLDQESQQILDWARKKMSEEQRIQELMSKHPGLKSAWEQYEVMKSLVSLNDDSQDQI